MNYRHSYHAGNAHEVFKHIALIQLIEHLKNKSSAYFFLDTHGGRGLYDLKSKEALAAKEAASGIHLFLQKNNLPPSIQTYCSIISSFNNTNDMNLVQYYPGSPLIAAKLKRSIDRMSVCELQSSEFDVLQKQLKTFSNVQALHQDGYSSIKALLPPKEKRGLIFIDPPYELLDEFSNVIKYFKEGLNRFATGIYALWYPIKSVEIIARFHKKLAAAFPFPIHISELILYPEDHTQLCIGSGMCVINPPWQYHENMQLILNCLLNNLDIHKFGKIRCHLIK